jgi:hypothetical protein
LRQVIVQEKGKKNGSMDQDNLSSIAILEVYLAFFMARPFELAPKSWWLGCLCARIAQKWVFQIPRGPEGESHNPQLLASIQY